MLRISTSLRSRLILLILISVLPMLALTIYGADEQRALATTNVRNEAERLAQFAAVNQSRLFMEGRQLLAVVAALPQVRGGNLDECSSLLADVLNHYRGYTTFAVIDAAGNAVCSAAPLSAPLSFADRDWYQRLRDTRAFVISGYQTGRISNKPTIVLAYPLLDEGGRLVGAVTAGLDLAGLGQFGAEEDVAREAALVMLDRQGTIGARYPDNEAWAGQPFPDASRLVALFDSGDRVVEVPGVDGVTRLYAFSPVAATNDAFYVAYGVPRSVVFAPIQRALARNLLLLVLVAFFSMALVWYGSDIVVLQRVNGMLAAARRVRAGDLTARTGVQYGREEISQLARAFDEMVETLESRKAEQEQAAEQIRRLNLSLEHRLSDLAAANRELEAFSYSVSHDLRAPLRAIDGFAQILVQEYKPQLDPDAQRYLGLVSANARQMGTLIDELLAFSRLGRKPLERRNVSLCDLVNRSLAELGAEREGREIDVRLGELPGCEGDPVLLKQVFLNLLSNALKFTRPRRPAVIEVGSYSNDGERVFFVRDNGVGFDMRYIDKLFGVFQRLHRAEDFEGTGVGLATVQRIVHRHGGRIWAEGEVDKGATFYFTLR